MKKGFTIIEILISITLILTIGISVTFFVINKKDKEIENLTNKILESSKLYLETEIDENGNIYKEGLFLGGTAVSIPISDLVNKGYLEENDLKTLENAKITDNKYVLAAVFSDEEDVCTNSESIIEFKVGWSEELSSATEPVYLCEYNKSGTTNSQSDDISKISYNFDNFLQFAKKQKIDRNKIAVSKEYYYLNTDKSDFLTQDENGIFYFYNVNTNNAYIYFRGYNCCSSEMADDNLAYINNEIPTNRLEFAGLHWRILWIRDDNTMKIVLDESIGTNSSTYFKTESGSTISVEYRDVLIDDKYLIKNYNKTVENNNIRVTGDKYEGTLVQNSFDYNNWISKHSINSFNYHIDESKNAAYCTNHSSSPIKLNDIYSEGILSWQEETKKINLNINFDCFQSNLIYGSEGINNMETYYLPSDSPYLIKNYYGDLQFGDLLMGGALSHKLDESTFDYSELKDSNYLINGNYEYKLIDNYYETNDTDTKFYISKTEGLSTKANNLFELGYIATKQNLLPTSNNNEYYNIYINGNLYKVADPGNNINVPTAYKISSYLTSKPTIVIDLDKVDMRYFPVYKDEYNNIYWHTWQSSIYESYTNRYQGGYFLLAKK